MAGGPSEAGAMAGGPRETGAMATLNDLRAERRRERLQALQHCSCEQDRDHAVPSRQP